MYHSITFDTGTSKVNTWDDWRLIPTSRPLIVPPGVKTQSVDVPGGNGSVDLTEALTGYPVYENRIGSWEFAVTNDFRPWNVAYSDIMSFLHGKRMKAILEDDFNFYYEGRFAVNQWASNKDYSVLTIDYNVYPYKRSTISSVEEWLWDPFDFEIGVIRDYNALSVSGELSVDIIGSDEPIVPIITVTTTDSSGMDVVVNGTTYHLTDGENVKPELLVQSGEHTFTFKGNGTVTINYREGRF